MDTSLQIANMLKDQGTFLHTVRFLINLANEEGFRTPGHLHKHNTSCILEKSAFKWWHIILYNYSFASNSGSYNLPLEEMKRCFGAESKLLTETACLPTSSKYKDMLFVSFYRRATAGCRQTLLMVTEFLLSILNYHLPFSYRCVCLSSFCTN